MGVNLGSIVLLALAAAVYPQLLAVVVIILTRPHPQPLLWACYLASLLVSVGSSVAIFVVFHSRGSVAGTTSHRLGPAAYLVIGAVALIFASVMTTRRGRELFHRDRQTSWGPERRPRRGSAAVANTRARAARALSEGPLVVACLIGGLLAIPGPFDLVALGRLARGGYGVAAAAAVMAIFALIKFILIEAPIAGYVIDRDRTAATVSRFSRWMQTNELAGIAAIVGLFGIALIGRGISVLG
ncbi:MAG TPA: GAP family protein [Solirubrobacteraceae bacterium]|nr:GAP family protein [Solirubrobacteraceae bacterium]